MRIHVGLIGLGLIGLLGVGVWGDDEATTQPAPSDEIRLHHQKIPTPFNLLTDLTDDQKAQILKIHTDTLAQEKLLRRRNMTTSWGCSPTTRRRNWRCRLERRLSKKRNSSRIRAMRMERQRSLQRAIEFGAFF